MQKLAAHPLLARGKENGGGGGGRPPRVAIASHMTRRACCSVRWSGLTNPRFMAAIHEFQTEPKKAKAKYQNDKAVIDFMTTFYGVLGNHFTEVRGWVGCCATALRCGRP